MGQWLSGKAAMGPVVDWEGYGSSGLLGRLWIQWMIWKPMGPVVDWEGSGSSG